MEKIEATARLVGGPHDGMTRQVKTDEFGNLGGYPVHLEGDRQSGGIYWPTFEREGDVLIYQWREGPEPDAPPWIKGEDGVRWPRIGRDPSGGIFFREPSHG